MFDIGGLELLLILLLALIVIGPERMPEIARTLGRTVGKARRFVAKTKADMDWDNQAELKEFANLHKEIRGELQDVEHISTNLQADLNQWERDIQQEGLDLNQLERPSFGGNAKPAVDRDAKIPLAPTASSDQHPSNHHPSSESEPSTVTQSGTATDAKKATSANKPSESKASDHTNPTSTRT